MAGWTARELARLLDVPVPTVSFWVSRGLITPQSYGRGRRGHTIGLSGLMELLTIIELRKEGISLQAIQLAVKNLRNLSGQSRPLARLTLVVAGGDILWKDAEELSEMPISALRKPGQRLLILPIGEKHAEFLEGLVPDSSFSCFTSLPEVEMH